MGNKGNCRPLYNRKGKQQFEPFTKSETYTTRRERIHQTVTKSVGVKKYSPGIEQSADVEQAKIQN